MRLLVWSYSLSLELKYKPQLHIAVFPLPPQKMLTKSQTTWDKMEFKVLLHFYLY